MQIGVVYAVIAGLFWGTSPVLVKRGIDVAVARLVERLAEMAHPMRSEDDYRRVA